MLWEQEVPGSTPGALTDVNSCQQCSYRKPLQKILGRGLYVSLYVRGAISGVRTQRRADRVES